MSGSERRCELRVWDSREAKKSGQAPIVAKGSPLQIVRKLLDLFVLAGEDIDRDIAWIASGCRRP